MGPIIFCPGVTPVPSRFALPRLGPVAVAANGAMGGVGHCGLALGWLWVGFVAGFAAGLAAKAVAELAGF